MRIAPPEDLIWHRLFIGERHRFDMADVVHLILHLGHKLDWDRLLDRVGGCWRLLLSQIHFFDFAYPSHRDRIPRSARERLRALELESDREDGPDGADDEEGPLTRGTLLSRYSFAIDVNEWGFHDARIRNVARVRSDPMVEKIRSAEVWNG